MVLVGLRMSEPNTKSPFDDIFSALAPWKDAASDIAKEVASSHGDILDKVADLLEAGSKVTGTAGEVADGAEIVDAALPCPICGNVICSCPGFKLT